MSYIFIQEGEYRPNKKRGRETIISIVYLEPAMFLQFQNTEVGCFHAVIVINVIPATAVKNAFIKAADFWQQNTCINFVQTAERE